MSNVTITRGDARAVVSPYGGHLLSWIDGQGREILFLSEKSSYSPGKAIRGGIPVIFPWFGKVEGYSQSHGFARNTEWKVDTVNQGSDPSVTVSLTENEQTMAVWPHPFRVELTYSLSDSLAATIKIMNTGATSFSFQFALHTYFTADGIDHVRVHGLEESGFIDKTKNGSRFNASGEPLAFSGLVDRIFPNARWPVSIEGIGDYTVEVNSSLQDCVTWNPGKIEGAKLSDLPENGFESFVCVEPGAIEVPISLAPGAEWTATQLLTVRG